jgi:alpha-ribazole phosphatase
LTKLFLVRHGQTLWNQNARYQGHTNTPLNDTGITQARLLAMRLATEPLQAVYSSDLKRAVDTARIIAEPHGLVMQTMPQLREINFGEWEGLTYQETKTYFGDISDRWHASPGSVRIPGGETFQELRERAYDAVIDLVNGQDQSSIAVVTHGATIRAIICALLSIDLNIVFRIRQDNAALNVIDYYGELGILSLLNDTYHLEPILGQRPALDPNFFSGMSSINANGLQVDREIQDQENML